jgi:hypothetical protein
MPSSAWFWPFVAKTIGVALGVAIALTLLFWLERRHRRDS